MRQFVGTAGARETVSSVAVPACLRFSKQKDVDCFQAYEAPCRCLDVLNFVALNDLRKAGKLKP